MTQLEFAKQGIITDAMRTVAHDERVSEHAVMEAVASGRAVIPLNIHRSKHCRAIGVGRMFRTKVNANLGCSPTRSDFDEEVKKLNVALNAGADFIMDLSVGDNVTAIREKMLAASPVPLGTVPIYETLSRLDGEIPEMKPELLLDVIEQQARQGVDFVTLHAGLRLAHVPFAARRKMGIVSRGGAIMAEWMSAHNCENPLYTHWDEVMDILRAHDVTVSLGDGMRPGCLADAGDAAQYGELDVLGELVQRCRAHGVQTMVEGPGHVPFHQIREQMERQQRVCDGAPFYVLGPVVCDVAPGYDHITSAIGATVATQYGASLLCYVTPAEHLGLPDADEVHAGIVAHRIAAHAGDIARGLPGATDADNAMADARMRFDWRGQFAVALDPATAEARWRKTRAPQEDEAACLDDHCSMCGKAFCAVRTSKRIIERCGK